MPVDRADVLGAGTTHSEDVREPDDNVLVHRNVDASNTCHVRYLLLTLALFVARVSTNDVDDATTAHDLAVLADLLD